MTSKEFLSQNRRITVRSQSKLDRIEELRALAERATSTLTGLPRGGGPGDRVAEIVAKIDVLERESADDLRDLVTVRADVTAAIRAVTDTDAQLVLELRYLGFLQWGEIAAKMGYELRQVHRIHEKALRLVAVPERYARLNHDI